MKEFIDKLIERLKKLPHAEEDMWIWLIDAEVTIRELAEEYKDKVMIDGQYCWQTCSATEHCKECNRLCNGSIDYYENYDFMAEEYKVSEMPTGWIPLTKQLPEYGQYVLACVPPKDGINGGHSVVIMEFREDNEPLFYRFVSAWQPLPAPYTEGE